MAQIRVEKMKSIRVGKHCQCFVGAAARERMWNWDFHSDLDRKHLSALALLPNLVSRSLAGVCEIKWNQTTLNCVIKQNFLRNFDIVPRRRRAYCAEITWNSIEHVPKLREHNDSIVSCFKRQEKCDKLFCLGNFPAEHWTLSVFSNLTPPPAFCGRDTCENLIHNRLRDSIRAHVAYYGSFQKGSEKFACLTM